MERKFTFDDMKFIARSERVGSIIEVRICDAWDECLLSGEYPAEADAPPAAPAKPKRGAGTKKRKSASGAASDEERAIADLIEKFKQQVEGGEIDLA